MKVLAPLVASASLEEVEDDIMIDRWAALMASAADPSDVQIQPAFPAMLAEMTAVDAQVLHLLHLGDVVGRDAHTFFGDEGGPTTRLRIKSESLRAFVAEHLVSARSRLKSPVTTLYG